MAPRQLRTAISFLVVLVSVAAYMTFTKADRTVDVSTSGTLPASPATIANFTPASRSTIIFRLREILRIREQAYRSRSPAMLDSIYSRDCPCLPSDRSAIDGLLRGKRVWDGIDTSLEIRDVTKLNERVWTVVGLFRSEDLYVRREDGRLVWKEPAGKDLFRFTLIKPQGEQDWLLGLVSVLQGSR